MKPGRSGTCPHCGKAALRLLKTYETVHNGIRQLFRCAGCGCGFSETRGTPSEHLKTPVSKVAGVFRVRTAYLRKCGDVTFLYDGGRRYGNTLFELCAEVLRNGGRGRPPKTLPPGVRVRLKNKGSQNGRKRPKPVLSIAEAYEAPHRDHPDTEGVPDADSMPITFLGILTGELRLEDILTARFA